MLLLLGIYIGIAIIFFIVITFLSILGNSAMGVMLFPINLILAAIWPLTLLVYYIND